MIEIKVSQSLNPLRLIQDFVLSDRIIRPEVMGLITIIIDESQSPKEASIPKTWRTDYTVISEFTIDTTIHDHLYLNQKINLIKVNKIIF